MPSLPDPPMGNDLNRMRIDASHARVQRQCIAWRSAGKVLALVPTMGALHEGHRALIRAARKRADKVVVSIFVNPAQFGPREDLSRYPRPLDADCAACRAEGADIVFAPTPADMYPPGFSTWVNEETLSTPLCGALRPGHFRGVCTVVTKLFMICQPHLAFFGWKDAQQTLVITRMVRDLGIPVEIVPCPTVREKDGLAMSSRNVYLTPAQRTQSPRIHAALRETVQLRRRGAGMARMRQHLHNALKRIPGTEIDYAEILDQATLQPVPNPHKGQPILIAVAVRMGTTRLIDNERFMW